MEKEIQFIETSIFNRQIEDLLTQTEYKAFKKYLAQNPDIAPIIAGTGGARKIRWAANNRGGKSGGVRIMYLYRSKQGDIFLLLAFSKKDQENLPPKQKAGIKALITALKEATGG